MRENLRNARKAAGMTQQQVAEKLGITGVAYGRLELGIRTGKVELWDKLEDMFNVHQRILRENTPTGSSPVEIGLVAKGLYESCGVPLNAAFARQLPGQNSL